MDPRFVFCKAEARRCSLVERRAALTLRLVDLEAEYAATVKQIERLDAELERARQLSGWREPC